MTVISAGTGYNHIDIDKSGIPVVSGTNMKVIELVISKISYGWSPEELHFQFPHLSMAQIYAALGYYWDHQDEIDKEIEQRYEKTEKLKKSLGGSTIKDRLKKKGVIR